MYGPVPHLRMGRLLIPSNVARQLARDLSVASSALTRKREALRALSHTHSSHIEEWASMDREPREDKKSKEVHSIYRMTKSKGNVLLLAGGTLI